MRIEIGLVDAVTVEVASVVQFKLQEAIHESIRDILEIEITRKNEENILSFNVPQFSNIEEQLKFAANLSFLAGQIVFQELTIVRLYSKNEENLEKEKV